MTRLEAPVIVYVSCNPYSMADDVTHFLRSGYRVEAVQPIDLFPHTPHCELVTRMTRRSHIREAVGEPGLLTK